MLIGKVAFKYIKSKRSSKGGSKSETAAFNQIYTLNMYGSLLNPLLLVYETGILYSKQNTEQNNSKSENAHRAYHLKTHILAESNVPLTLYGNRTVDESSTSDNYGLNWRGKFQTLPKTNLDINRSVTETWQNTDYRLKLRKDLTNSKNEFDYTLSEIEARKSPTKHSTTAMNFTNRTSISRSTSINFRAAKGTSEADDGAKSHAEGLSVGLSSSPSKRFNQSHGYYYNNSEAGDSQQTGEGYNGSMGYGFSDDLHSSMSLATSHSETDSLTTRRETDVLSTSGSLSYRASRKLSISESIRYSTVDILGSTAGQDNMSDKTSLKVRTRASYHTKLSWANMSTAYGLGYVEETRTGNISTDQRDRGTAIHQNLSLKLTGMDAWGYAAVAASSGYGYSEPLKGDYNNQNFNFSTSAVNKIWKKYVDLSASYNKSIHRSSWIAADDSERDRLSLRGRSLYLTEYLNPDGNGRTVLNFQASRTSASDDFEGKRINNAQSIDMNHNRILYNGMLSGSIGYGSNQSSFGDNKDSSMHVNIWGQYERMLLRRIAWKAKFNNKMEKTAGYKRYRSSIINNFRYRLRVWTLGAEHQFRWRRQSRSRSTDNRIMLNASRGFVRVF